jgi:hypothetical protein
MEIKIGKILKCSCSDEFCFRVKGKSSEDLAIFKNLIFSRSKASGIKTEIEYGILEK